MHRFFVDKNQIPLITGSDAHQIRAVLRMKKEDRLELLDGTGRIHLAEIAEIKKDKVLCKVISSRFEGPETKIKVSIAQCLPKGKKMDLIIQKCTELGAHKIIPILSERSIAKGGKPERWQKIAKEAAEQSGRTTMPEVSPLASFEDLLKTVNGYDLGLIPWELEKETTLKSVLKKQKPSRLLIIIGPEGGFSAAEAAVAQEKGFHAVSLGPNILRAETAAVAVLGIIGYEYS